MAEGTEQVAVERHGAVAAVALNRPEKRNALSMRLRRELMDTLETLRTDDAVRAVVLSGRGAMFCAGFDLSEFTPPERQREVYENSSLFHRRLWHFDKPVVAALHGAALAGGLDLALLCDVRICTPETWFGHPEVKFGAVPLFGLLKYVVGEGHARHLCLTGELFDAERAHGMGLVTEVVPEEALQSRALELAGTIAEVPPATLRTTKQCMAQAAGLDFDTAFTMEHDRGLARVPLDLSRLPRK